MAKMNFGAVDNAGGRLPLGKQMLVVKVAKPDKQEVKRDGKVRGGVKPKVDVLRLTLKGTGVLSKTLWMPGPLVNGKPDDKDAGSLVNIKAILSWSTTKLAAKILAGQADYDDPATLAKAILGQSVGVDVYERSGKGDKKDNVYIDGRIIHKDEWTASDEAEAENDTLNDAAEGEEAEAEEAEEEEEEETEEEEEEEEETEEEEEEEEPAPPPKKKKAVVTEVTSTTAKPTGKKKGFDPSKI